MRAIKLRIALPSIALFAFALAATGLPFWARALSALTAVASVVLAMRALAAEVERPIGALANVLEGLRKGDRGMRARTVKGSLLADVQAELNALAELLHVRGLADVESGALLAAVLRELDAAVLTFDDARRLRLVNPAGEQVLGLTSAQAVGRTAAELGVEAWFMPEEEVPRDGDGQARGALGGPFAIRRIPFRRDGIAHELVVVTNLAGALRSEERHAWRSLFRVLSHEINNSLTPIATIAGAHKKLLDAGRFDASIAADLAEGLDVVARRAEGLRAFIASYALVARLPPPTLAAVSVASWVHRVAALETRVAVAVEGHGDPTIVADPNQIEQLLVNLVRNAADAALDGGGHVVVRWEMAADTLAVEVDDDGPGLASEANLFVPFYTTKPGGSGIGLALGRAIAEAHGGVLTLRAREGGRETGCRARLVLPIDAARRAPHATTRASLPRRGPDDPRTP